MHHHFIDPKKFTVHSCIECGPEQFTGPLAHAKPEKWPLKPGELRNMVKGIGGAELKPKLEESAKSWFNSKLEEAEKSVVKHYTSHGYRAINKYLRGLSDSTSTASKNELELQAKRLNTALTKSQSPPPPEIVWRGISDASDPHWQKIVAQIKPEAVIKLDGFQSTSVRPVKALGNSDELTFGSLLEIKPKRGAYVGDVSSVPGEDEFLMRHGSKYKVVGVAKLKYESPYYAGQYTERVTVQVEELDD